MNHKRQTLESYENIQRIYKDFVKYIFPKDSVI